MSQRIGMADGRCFTIYPSSRLLNDYVMQENQIAYQDNYTYRQLLMQRGLAVMDDLNAPAMPDNPCQPCRNLLKLSHVN